MSYITEFPDYDGKFYCPKGWEDNSWHNDVCPHIEKKSIDGDARAYVWQDYVDVNKREYDNLKRYMFQIHIKYDLIYHYETDDIEEVLRIADGIQF